MRKIESSVLANGAWLALVARGTLVVTSTLVVGVLILFGALLGLVAGGDVVLVVVLSGHVDVDNSVLL